MLDLDQLVVGYGHNAILAPISVGAAAGAFICVLGRNGAGKSTLLRTLAGLQPGLGGVARLTGNPISGLSAAARARRIAVVLTERASSPGLTVDDVVALGRAPFTGWDGRLGKDDRRAIDAALSATGAADFQGRLFDSLSDGERQRVMIARALAQAPQLMILDEITAFLDLPGRVEMMTRLRRHARQLGTVVLLSSHDLDLSLQLADTLWLLPGQARFSAGRPDALVADGLIGTAFDSDDVAFDATTGRFRLVDPA